MERGGKEKVSRAVWEVINQFNNISFSAAQSTFTRHKHGVKCKKTCFCISGPIHI